MTLDDAYTELGLARDAAEAQVKAAWRRLVSQWHPDRNPSQQAGLRMQRINRAFNRIRAEGFADSAAPGPAPTPAPAPAPEDVAPTAGAPAEPVARRTVHRKLKLCLEDAALGCTQTLSGRLSEPCAPCEGTGWQLRRSPCVGCKGTGKQAAPLWFGLFSAPSACTACEGSGLGREACPACEGRGKAATRAWQVAARIPPGVRSGDVLGVDNPASAALPVHVELRIELLPHPLFRLDEDGTVHCRVPVDGFTWLTQRPLEVPTLDGLQWLPVQREQRRYRLPGLGFPSARRGPRADAVVEIEPVFPAEFSAAQQALLDQLMASTRSADAAAPAGPLAAWQQALADWQRGLQRMG